MAGHGSRPASSRCASRMSSYSIGNASADSRHSRSVRMSGAGWPDLVQARTTGARASNSAPSTASQMSSVFTSDRLGTWVPRAADPYSMSATRRGPNARVAASPRVSMVSCAAMQENVHAVEENQQDCDTGQAWRSCVNRTIVHSAAGPTRRLAMLRCRAVPSLLVLPLLVLGCATSRPFDRSTEPGGKPLSPTTAGSVIITGEALSADPGRTVLDAVRKAMPQLHISGWSQYSRCPILELRGKDSVTGSSNPDVYVDGTRTVDTCPLVTIQAMDAHRIEVYPLGVTSRPGYSSSGHGLILIFLQRSDTTGN